MNKYNLDYDFDDELREVPENPEDVLNYVLEEKEKLKTVTDPKDRVGILGRIGSFTRMLKKLDDAEAFLGEALELINKHDLGVKLWVVNGIRLAQVYQWMRVFDIAEEMFFNIVEMCEEKEEASEYLNFAFQHFGKFYFDLGEYEEALEYFEEAMGLRKAIGDESLIKSTQFAIDVTKKHIKEDNVINFSKNNFEGDALKDPRDILEIVKERVSGNEFLTIDDLNQELSQVTYNQNNLPKAPFLGLSPGQMHNVLYRPFEFENNIFIINLSSDQLTEVPLIKQASYFLKKLRETNDLKATQKGNLPKAFVVEMYNEFFREERYARLPNKEDDLLQLTRLKHLLDISGLIKKRRNKFSLTKKGETIVDKDNGEQLFKLLVDSFFNKWNWAYGDGYSELPLIQSSAVFNLYLLHKKARDWTLGEDLGKAFLNAFPALVNEVGDSYFGPEKEIINCFNIRFLDRVCRPLGILEFKEEGHGFDRKVFYKVSDFFEDSFRFDNGDLKSY